MNSTAAHLQRRARHLRKILKRWEQGLNAKPLCEKARQFLYDHFDAGVAGFLSDPNIGEQVAMHRRETVKGDDHSEFPPGDGATLPNTLLPL
jgi:hypothetical protein